MGLRIDVPIVEAADEFLKVEMLRAAKTEPEVVELVRFCAVDVADGTMEVAKLLTANEGLVSPLTISLLTVAELEDGDSKSVLKSTTPGEELAIVEWLTNGALLAIPEMVEGVSEIIVEVLRVTNLESVNDELPIVDLLTNGALVAVKKESELTELKVAGGTLEVLTVETADNELAVPVLFKNFALDVVILDAIVLSEGIMLDAVDRTLEVVDRVEINEELATIELLTNPIFELVGLGKLEEILKVAKLELLDEASFDKRAR